MPNRKRMGIKPCSSEGSAIAFDQESCPTSSMPSRGGRGTEGLLFFSTQWGLLTNCLMVINVARWLAEQLGKTLVLPLCTSSENPEHTCSVRRRANSEKQRRVMVNMTAIWTSRSLGGCSTPREPVELRSTASRLSTQLTCIGLRPEDCAVDVMRDPQLDGVVLSRWVRYEPLLLALAWLARQPTDAPPRKLAWAAGSAAGAAAGYARARARLRMVSLAYLREGG